MFAVRASNSSFDQTVFVLFSCSQWPVPILVRTLRSHSISSWRGVRFHFTEPPHTLTDALIVYANSFLATLNVRDHMRDRSHSGGVITTSDFQVHPRTNNSAMQLTNVSHELDNFPRQKTQIVSLFIFLSAVSICLMRG